MPLLGIAVAVCVLLGETLVAWCGDVVEVR